MFCDDPILLDRRKLSEVYKAQQNLRTFHFLYTCYGCKLMSGAIETDCTAACFPQ